jgi:hypothetical protein
MIRKMALVKMETKKMTLKEVLYQSRTLLYSRGTEEVPTLNLSKKLRKTSETLTKKLQHYVELKRVTLD